MLQQMFRSLHCQKSVERILVEGVHIVSGVLTVITRDNAASRCALATPMLIGLRGQRPTTRPS